MIEEIADTRLQHFLRMQFEHLDPYWKNKFRTIRLCGSRVVMQKGNSPLVYVLANDETAKFLGTATCKNPWICPICSAKSMAKHAADIACAIEALKAQGQVAFMLTLTIPHSSGMSCEETTNILFKTWADFTVHGNKNLHVGNYVKRDGKKVLVRSEKKLKDPFASFCEEFNCKFRVRVGEYTWGEHGWHPHFHCLFWVDQKKIQSVKDWQNLLCARWLQLAKRSTIRYWQKLYPDKPKSQIQTRADIMYQNLNEGSIAAYISTDKNGKVIVQQSSMYICGWGADRELTSNVKNKASKEGHLTPHQMLEKASHGDEKMWQLFLEYAKATKTNNFRRRVQFSKKLKDIINQYKQTQQYIETLKKKAIEDAKNRGQWRMVCWFNQQQWRDICLAEKILNEPIRYMILQLATLKDKPREAIEDFLLNNYDIDISKTQKPMAGELEAFAKQFNFIIPAA